MKAMTRGRAKIPGFRHRFSDKGSFPRAVPGLAMPSNALQAHVKLLVDHLERRAKRYGQTSLQSEYSRRVLQSFDQYPTTEREVLDTLVEATGIEEETEAHYVGLASECHAAEAVWDFIRKV